MGYPVLPGFIWRVLEIKGDNSLLLAIVSDNLCRSLEVKREKSAPGSRIFCGILILLSSLVEEYFCTCPRRRKFTAPSNSCLRAKSHQVRHTGCRIVRIIVSLFLSVHFLDFFFFGTFLGFLFGSLFLGGGRLSCLLVTRQSHLFANGQSGSADMYIS